ncbi:MAG: hypothetical protein B7Y93_08965 [Micrococcales bacterium 32-70-13]|nr:MAG: hypothetical protein B7Y93_08965 [Micrococcales bacterium 32-70-13]
MLADGRRGRRRPGRHRAAAPARLRRARAPRHSRRRGPRPPAPALSPGVTSPPRAPHQMTELWSATATQGQLGASSSVIRMTLGRRLHHTEPSG